MHSAMCCYAGNAQACALLRSHARRKRHSLRCRDHGKFSGDAERAIGLCAVAPHRPPQPLRRNTISNLIHSPGAVAMGNYARVWHTQPKGVPTLLGIARIDSRRGQANANFPRPRGGIGHIANDENLPRGPLSLIPGCFHDVSRFHVNTELKIDCSSAWMQLLRGALASPLAARSPGLRLAFVFALALEIERDCSADEILQSRRIHLVAFVDVDGAPNIPVEAGVEQARRGLQRSSLGKRQLYDVLVRLSGADDAAVG